MLPRHSDLQLRSADFCPLSRIDIANTGCNKVWAVFSTHHHGIPLRLSNGVERSIDILRTSLESWDIAGPCGGTAIVVNQNRLFFGGDNVVGMRVSDGEIAHHLKTRVRVDAVNGDNRSICDQKTMARLKVGGVNPRA